MLVSLLQRSGKGRRAAERDGVARSMFISVGEAEAVNLPRLLWLGRTCTLSGRLSPNHAISCTIL